MCSSSSGLGLMMLLSFFVSWSGVCDQEGVVCAGFALFFVYDVASVGIGHFFLYFFN